MALEEGEELSEEDDAPVEALETSEIRDAALLNALLADRRAEEAEL